MDEPAASGEGSRPIVLVLEPNDGVRCLLSRVLLQRGATVVEATGTAEALRLAADRRPTVALVDALLDEVLGTDFVRLLRRLAPGIRIGVLTAAAPEGELDAVDAMFAKPFRLKEMQRWVLEGNA